MILINILYIHVYTYKEARDLVKYNITWNIEGKMSVSYVDWMKECITNYITKGKPGGITTMHGNHLNMMTMPTNEMIPHCTSHVLPPAPYW